MMEMQALEQRQSYQDWMNDTERLLISACYISLHFFDNPLSHKFSEQVAHIPAPVISDELKQKIANSKMRLPSRHGDNNPDLIEDAVANIFLHVINHNYSIMEYSYHRLSTTDKRAFECSDESQKSALIEKANQQMSDFITHHYEEPDSFDSKRLQEIKAISALRDIVKGEKNEMLLTLLLDNVEDQITNVTNDCHALSSEIMNHKLVA